jgi:hypothetical protein
MNLRNLTKAVILSATLSAAVLTSTAHASDESLCYDGAELALIAYKAANLGSNIQTLKDSIERTNGSDGAKKFMLHMTYFAYNNQFMQPKNFRSLAYIECKRYRLNER